MKTKLIRIYKSDYDIIMEQSKKSGYPVWYIVEKLLEKGLKEMRKRWAESLSI